MTRDCRLTLRTWREGSCSEQETHLFICSSDDDVYRLYNLDVFGYKIHSKMGIYGSVPLLLTHKLDRTIGVFWLNSSETLVEIATKAAMEVSTALEFCLGWSLKMLLKKDE